MSEMIDRVAKALWGSATTGTTWEDALVSVHFMHAVQLYRESAKAAIEVMREPTGHMGAIATRVMLTNELWGKDSTDDQRVLTAAEQEAIGFSDHLSGNPSRWSMPVWRAMIDEALK